MFCQSDTNMASMYLTNDMSKLIGLQVKNKTMIIEQYLTSNEALIYQ